MSEIEAKTEVPRHLKGIYQTLKEIDDILLSPTQSLDILVNGEHPVTETGQKAIEGGTTPSMENLVSVVTSINRSANRISKFTNRLVGN